MSKTILVILSVCISLASASSTCTTDEIVLNSNCFIKNRKYNEYLYTAGVPYNKDSLRRQIFTWIPGGACYDDCKWQFTKDAGHTSYKIKSTSFSEYIYSVYQDRLYDSERRHVFAWIPDDCHDPECYWTIKKVPGTNVYFTIVSDRYGEYLFADNLHYDDDRRFVFSLRSYDNTTVNEDKSAHWLIEC